MSDLPVPRVLVLLAAYHGERWVIEQVNSIRAQVGVDVTIIVSDDASTDATVKLLEAAFPGERQLQIVRKSRPSGSAGANFRSLFRRVDAKGYAYVAFADQDDVWHPEKLIAGIRELLRTGAHGYSCSVNAFAPDGKVDLVSQCSKTRLADYLFEGAGQGCTFVLTEALFLKVQEFCRLRTDLVEAMHFHDWLVYLLARTWGMAWHFDARAWMQYRRHDSNDIGPRVGLKAAASRLRKIRNGWYSNQIRAALDVALAADPASTRLARFSEIYLSNKTLGRQCRLAWFFFRHGRRKLSDRNVMVLSALMAWV